MSDIHDKPSVAIIERHAETSGVSPVVSAGLAILKQDPSPETLRELLTMQREYEANEARKAYSMALVGLKRDLPTVIERDKTVAFGTTKYTHASLAGVMDAVTGPLTEHGFSLTWKPSTGVDGVSVTCRLTHRDGHYEETAISAPADKSGSKSAPQAVASTITLLQRYTALSLLGIATADMEEPENEGQRSADPKRVDSARNLRAVGRLKQQYGKSREDAEAFVGRNVPDWTDEDLSRLMQWAKSSASGASQS